MPRVTTPKPAPPMFGTDKTDPPPPFRGVEGGWTDPWDDNPVEEARREFARREWINRFIAQSIARQESAGASSVSQNPQTCPL
jgi:hypothetical protein